MTYKFSVAKKRGYKAIIAWQNCFIASFGFIFLLFKSPNSVNMKVDGVFIYVENVSYN